MKHIRTLIAVPVLACGIVLAGASQAWLATSIQSRAPTAKVP